MSDEQTTNKQARPGFEAFIDHQRQAFEEAQKALEALIPPDARSHGQAAFNHSIEGIRVLVNGILDEFQSQFGAEDKPEGEKSEKAEAKTTGRSKVKVNLS
jgi:hypothetical protein